MKSLLLFILALTASISAYNQPSPKFEIKEVFIDTSANLPINITRRDANFFEDGNYIVTKSCSGEWGGTIKFKNKSNGIEYSCSATCPVVVNKMDGKYIVTSTLAHMHGSSAILEIDSPGKLSIFKAPPPIGILDNKPLGLIGDDESKSTQGTITLLNCLDTLTLMSFPYRGGLYHVITDFNQTFLAKIENKKFIIVDTICQQSIWTYDPEVIKTTGYHFVVGFSNAITEGYLDVFENKITLYRYKPIHANIRMSTPLEILMR